MYTPESYLPGTSDNPKSGRRPKESRDGQSYLVIQNPFLDLADMVHANIPNPEEALILKEERMSESADGERGSEKMNFETWMPFEPFDSDDLPSTATGHENMMDFSPLEQKINRGLIPREKIKNPARKESTDRGVARIQREANLTLKRKSSEKNKAA